MAPNKWKFLEKEFDSIIEQTEKALYQTKNLAKMTPHTKSLLNLYEMYQSESEIDNECIICLKKLSGQSYLAKQKRRFLETMQFDKNFQEKVSESRTVLKCCK